MAGLDWGVIGLYFFALLGLTWYSVRKNRDTADDYFLAGRNLGWFIVAASIFSSNIGSEHLVGLAGSGCTDGVAMAHYELHAWCLLVLAWVFVPFYARSMVYTMPEFLERRYSPAARYVLSIISLVAYIGDEDRRGHFCRRRSSFPSCCPKCMLDLGFVVLDAFWIGSFAVVVLTGLYTVLGGLRAVAYTDTLQTVIFIIGSAMVTVFGLIKLGGWEELRTQCGSEMFNLWKPLVPAGMEATWAPVKEMRPDRLVLQRQFSLAGHVVLRTDRRPVVLVHRSVHRAAGAGRAERDDRPARQHRRGADEAAAGVHLHHSRHDLLRPGQAGLSRPDPIWLKTAGRSAMQCQAAFPLMVKHVLPVGVRGLVVAGLLSALMSSLAGVFNACSTLFTMDLYQKFRPKASQHQLVWIGRVATAVMVLIGLFWIPVIRGQRGLYFYLQAVQGYLAPPIFVVFFLGVFNKRLNSKGCLSALGGRLPAGRFPAGGRYAGTTGLARLRARLSRKAPSSGSSTTSISNTTAC